ncbi:hypothetical protein [Vibrio parahaemolyticus]|uniref:hypothetical protein n=1 Tax=Vibrio parahaemolyticus TaxID=670 RepID=UPI00226A5F66|nr:hypothetical protein [Vibrio parahaemolyticus]MCX8796394.1 hypothetical protein [Vibrio parahaemolyticus]
MSRKRNNKLINKILIYKRLIESKNHHDPSVFDKNEVKADLDIFITFLVESILNPLDEEYINRKIENINSYLNHIDSLKLFDQPNIT